VCVCVVDCGQMHLHLQRLGRRVRVINEESRLGREGCNFSCNAAEGAANDSTLSTAGN
jgi:hypothetical protein